MRAFTLSRIAQDERETRGLLSDEESRKIAVTLELPWKDNQHDVSCVPAGTYQAKRIFSPKHGFFVFCLQDVPNRANVEIHPGNTPKDTLGCILLGTEFADIDEDGELDIAASRIAFTKFMDGLVGVDEITLTVVDP